eukprot:TRINITY_DN54959_c0_g1_i1.p1 TRINITY_DN54959_c0_g1~~TRINITY_DN54959_c0_g1_i1.p1  ORF type:complete len:507 (-),score=75.61 TRINITY_DN54959_c0_g1_i1:69-1589(-)
MRWRWLCALLILLLPAEDASAADEDGAGRPQQVARSSFRLELDDVEGCLAPRPTRGVQIWQELLPSADDDGSGERRCVRFERGPRSNTAHADGFELRAVDSVGGGCLDLGERSYFDALPTEPVSAWLQDRWSLCECTGYLNQRVYEKIDGRLCIAAERGTFCLRPVTDGDAASSADDVAARGTEVMSGDALVHEELQRWGGVGGLLTRDHRWATLAQLLASAHARVKLHSATAPIAEPLPEVRCPAHGAGVGDWGSEMEEHHFKRHNMWATQSNFCREGTGLWTNGCDVSCPLRAAVIATTVGLRPGGLVLDVGSGCGHFAVWLHRWFGARTIGVDFVEDAVDFARHVISPNFPASFCWYNVASEGLDFVPARSVDLAMAVSVLHYLRTDTDAFERPPRLHLRTRNDTEYRTPCAQLRETRETQCAVAHGMFRAVRPGGHLWIAHNGCYKAKWDPKRVWGPQYWQCCFGRELDAGEAALSEVSELDLFMYSPSHDPTYSVVMRRLK